MSLPWTARVLTILPEVFPGALGQSLTGRAMEDGVWRLDTVNIRDFATDRHRSVDDTPAGGGPGMVLRADVVAAAIDGSADPGGPLLALSPRGRRLDQAMARELSAGPGLSLICGRVEGIDERLFEARGVEEVSLGDFILSGGEIAAMALIDACVRLIGRVLGNPGSIEDESFSTGLLEYPQYTRPAVWEGRDIPDVLVSGDHGRIAAWRNEQAEKLTQERRPDLWKAYAAASVAGQASLPEQSDRKVIASKGEQMKDG